MGGSFIPLFIGLKFVFRADVPQVLLALLVVWQLGMMFGGLGMAFVGSLRVRRLTDRGDHLDFCPRCAYSLDGLGLDDEKVTCPECGQKITLVESRKAWERVGAW